METKRELFHKFPTRTLMDVLAAGRLLMAGKGSQAAVLAKGYRCGCKMLWEVRGGHEGRQAAS